MSLGKASYKVDYCGGKGCYNGAKDSYMEGEEVILRYMLIATDTDYSFYIDGQQIMAYYSNGGMEIKFVMPGHDIKVECVARNTMVNMSGRGPGGYKK